MANTNPGGQDTNQAVGDADRGNNPSEPANPEVIADAMEEPILESRDFPSGGGEGEPNRRADAAGGGSTGRGATDAGKTDSEGTAGGGMAGSAGG